MITRFKQLSLALGLAGALGAVTNPALAQVNLNVRLGPQPPPRHEFVGRPPRPECRWVRGHYVARGNRWFWVNGHWYCRH